jgi:hypothetical protein
VTRNDALRRGSISIRKNYRIEPVFGLDAIQGVDKIVRWSTHLRSDVVSLK